MITKERLIERHEKLIEYVDSGDTSYGSQPISTFDFYNGKFNERNWNGADGIIRQFVGSLTLGESYSEEFEIEDHNYGEIVVGGSYFNDQQYFQITLRHVKNNGDWIFTQYLVTFYKRRGATDWISKNGQTINFDEYVELLNIIEASGFKFDLSI